VPLSTTPRKRSSAPPPAPLRPLRIGLDARLVARGLGIATYVRELAHELVRRADIDAIVWFGPPDGAPAHPKVRVRPLDRWPHPLLDTALGARAVAREGVDVMHFTGNTGWTGRAGVPRVVTVHDLIFLAEGGEGGTRRQRLGRRYMARNVPRAARTADRVIAVSAATAGELAERDLRIEPEPRVIRHGVRAPADPPAPAPGPSSFVVFGGADPRKNVGLAVDAFADAGTRLPAGTRMAILAGAGLDAALAGRLSAGDLPIDVIGYVPRHELWQRLAGALALVHPTTAEGFGFPVLDAMAAGTPVIGGLTPVTRELAGDALLQIDPAHPRRSLADALVELARDGALRDRLVAEGRRRAQGFSWERCAAGHVEVYREALAA